MATMTVIGAYFAYAFNAAYGTGEKALNTTAIIALGILAAFMTVGFYLMFMYRKGAEFAIEVEDETKKITWPEWINVKSHTWQVIIVMIFLTGYLFVVDIFLGYFRGVVL